MVPVVGTEHNLFVALSLGCKHLFLKNYMLIQKATLTPTSSVVSRLSNNSILLFWRW